MTDNNGRMACVDGLRHGHAELVIGVLLKYRLSLFTRAANGETLLLKFAV